MDLLGESGTQDLGLAFEGRTAVSRGLVEDAENLGRQVAVFAGPDAASAPSSPSPSSTSSSVKRSTTLRVEDRYGVEDDFGASRAVARNDNALAPGAKLRHRGELPPVRQRE